MKSVLAACQFFTVSDSVRQLAGDDAVVCDEIGVDWLETFLTEKKGNLSAVVGRMIDKMDHHHLDIVGILVTHVIIVSHFPIEVVGDVHEIKPLFSRFCRQIHELT